MKQHATTFNAEMIRAILDGRKSQTRRIVKLDKGRFVTRRDRHSITCCLMRDGIGPVWNPHGGAPEQPLPQEMIEAASPYGQPGDLLWVKETFADTKGMGFDNRFYYKEQTQDGSDGDETRKRYGVKWKSPILMPRKASRITLKIKDIRVERIQDINEEDALAEGACDPGLKAAYHASDYTEYGDEEEIPGLIKRDFQSFWNSLHPESWKRNDWVWVISFARLKEDK